MELRKSQVRVIIIAMTVFGFTFIPAQEPTRLTNPIYVQSTGLSGSVENRVQMVAEAGYDGIMWEGPSGDIPAVLSALDAQGLGMIGLWRPANGDIPSDAALLDGTEAQLMLYATGGAYSNDDAVISDIAAVADLVKDEGRLVTLYPHAGDYVETIDDAVRIIEKLNRDNVGLSFNLCHSLMYHSVNNLNFADRFDSLLQKAWPYIQAVSINGADSVGYDWGTLIRPLGEGNFDTFGLVKTVIEKGYTGPFLLQAFGIGGDIPAHLAQSFSVWEDYKNLLPAVEGCMDTTYLEYNPEANVNVGDSCRTLKIPGCMDPGYAEYNPEANVEPEGACVTGISEPVFSRSNITWNGITVHARGKHSVRILDLQGRTVIYRCGNSSKNYKLNRLLNPGIYYVDVRTVNDVITDKILFMQ
jgi:sugar phosphate isomerase/epimerase